jgi:hypothetical protein
VKRSRRDLLLALGGVVSYARFGGLRAQTNFASYSDADREAFLRGGMVVSVSDIGEGVTKPIRAELSLKGVTHSAQIQVVDRGLPDFFGDDGSVLPMRDAWRFNVAAYRIDRLLKLNMVPPSVSRAYKGTPGAFTWWADDVKGQETQRVNEGWKAPDIERFEQQRAIGRVFDELIMNIDRNLGNLLITNSWQVVLIDHTRSFTAYRNIRNRANLTRCSRALLAQMSALTEGAITKSVGASLTRVEIAALLARRDLIVAFFAEAAKTKGAENVLFG